jgi:DNA repair protein RecO (recombination protein O)
MKPPRAYQSEAVVIKRIKLGEADRILTLYTPNFGKVRAVAKGSRRTTSKLGGHVELLTYSQLMIARGRNLDIITQAQTIDNFLPLKENLDKLSYGLYISELVDCFTPDQAEDSRLFKLLLDTLQQLAQDKDADCILRYFELHLLDYAGYRPQIHQCADCGASLQPMINAFSTRLGGILCQNCSYQESTGYSLSLNAIKVLRLWQNCDYTVALRVKVEPQLASELERVIRSYIKFLLEKQLKSTEWLDQLRYGAHRQTLQNAGLSLTK